jgi:hypothetical protein
MAGNTIEQYRIAFDKMQLAQKKIFIDRLRNQIHGKDLPAYARLLAECVQKYNAEARGGVASTNPLDNLLVGLSGAETGGAIAFENRIEEYKANGYKVEKRNGDSVVLSGKSKYTTLISAISVGFGVFMVLLLPFVYAMIIGSMFGGIMTFANIYFRKATISITRTGRIEESGNVLEKK